MKRLISTATVGVVVTVIVLGLIVIDYKILKTKGFLHSNLKEHEDRKKVYNVDTMAVVLKKIEDLSKKIDYMSNALETRIPKFHGVNFNKAKMKSSTSTKKADVKGPTEKKRPVNSLEIKKPSLFNSREMYPADVRINKPIVKPSKQLEKEPLSGEKTPFGELFNLTRIFKKFEKERKERKELEEKDKQLQAIKNKENSQKGISNKDDVFQAVKEKFGDATDLSPKRNSEDGRSSTNFSDSPLFFHPISEMGRTPFDNIPNLTDFSGTISSTFISSLEKPNEEKDTKPLSKIESKGPQDITELINNRADPKTIKESAKLDSSTSNSPKKLNYHHKEDDKLSLQNSTKFADPFNYRSKGSASPNGDRPNLTSMKIKSEDNFTNSGTFKNVKSEDLFQSEADRQLEQMHLQKENEKKNSLLSDFDQIEKELNKKQPKPEAGSTLDPFGLNYIVTGQTVELKNEKSSKPGSSLNKTKSSNSSDKKTTKSKEPKTPNGSEKNTEAKLKTPETKSTLKKETKSPEAKPSAPKTSEEPTVVVNKSLHISTTKDDNGSVIGVAIKKNSISTAVEVDQPAVENTQKKPSETSRHEVMSPVKMSLKGDDALENDRSDKLISDENSETSTNSSSSKNETALKKNNNDYHLDVASNNQ
ncbi:hypothetical protein NGRA_0448 [Nosema granulosis]|uniref:Uncharacterized protein n=1 Tax=Nosema granulosis TaxID=83296 RepID=A0A9P6H301_9MICR|nr:hypothetical protein NGRA_0448 [Nosema granulosis]